MKILALDIETSPNLAYVWGKYEQYAMEYENEWHILSFAYKFIGEKSVKAFSLPDFKLYKKDSEDDTELVKKLHELMEEADVILGHNSDDFDIKKINSRFIAIGLKPPSPSKSIDTLKILRKYFKFNSNKLDDVCKHLELGQKIETSFDLWLGCIKKDKKAWKYMVKYNKMDVELLEKLYFKLLPWIQNHPNVNILRDRDMACPNCGSQNIQRRGWSVTTTGKRARYQCQEPTCGRWATSKHTQSVVEIK